MKNKWLLLFIFSFRLVASAQEDEHSIFHSAQKMYESKKYTEALIEIEKCLSVKHDFDSALCLRAQLSYRTGNKNMAVSDLNLVIKENGNYFDAFYTRGIIKAEGQDYVGAMRDLNKAIELNAKNAKAFYNRALVRAYLDDYPSAIKDLNKAIEINPSYKEAFYSRGFWKEMSNDFKAAIIDYKKAVALDPGYSEAGIALAIATYRSGDKSGGCAVLQTMIDKGNTKAIEMSELFCK